MRAFERLRMLLARAPRAHDPAFTAQELGRWGEDWAAWYYWSRRGGAVLARNWRGGGGELDLVVREGNTLVFVEVKARPADDPEPLAQVRDPRRQRHFRAAASAWLGQLARPRPAVRFDALVVSPPPAGDSAVPLFTHHSGILSLDGRAAPSVT
ncbi:MAG: putative endonuclease [Candidatus Sumerlaeota bacterium]|nr:putative endonuclease [Candidatus Sumerlaeota bacterium]